MEIGRGEVAGERCEVRAMWRPEMVSKTLESIFGMKTMSDANFMCAIVSAVLNYPWVREIVTIGEKKFFSNLCRFFLHPGSRVGGGGTRRPLGRLAPNFGPRVNRLWRVQIRRQIFCPRLRFGAGGKKHSKFEYFRHFG